MEKFTSHTGVAAPLRRSNVDTDQIIPAEYLKRVTRSGYEDALFSAWRDDENFVLNHEKYRDATVLVAGPDFGTGSSREHAVWALQNYGFKAVISARFADIFRGNAGKGGLLTVQLTEPEVEEIWAHIEADPGAHVTVDLVDCTVHAADSKYHFEIDPYVRWRLLEGLDDIGITLNHEADIESFEQNRPAYKPTTV